VLKMEGLACLEADEERAESEYLAIVLNGSMQSNFMKRCEVRCFHNDENFNPNLWL
jgi:hypothetical protein